MEEGNENIWPRHFGVEWNLLPGKSQHSYSTHLKYLAMFSEALRTHHHDREAIVGVRSFSLVRSNLRPSQQILFKPTSPKLDPISRLAAISHKVIRSALKPPLTPCTAHQRWSFACRFFPPRSTVWRSLISSMLRLKALPDSRTASGVKRSNPKAPIITWSSSQTNG